MRRGCAIACAPIKFDQGQDVPEESCGALLNDVLHPQPHLDILEQTTQEGHEVLRQTNVAGNGLCGTTAPDSALTYF
ncbi:hypothetical protein IscW_ISCW000860 [Ixodes scapularis]|uniref:Uncharacterized protein n=1 Tax=Ixodes scapularis TaxID=6945 RepID=B7P2J9_IXOSC|nr:hypothetical protein IscW_ISCW000860 [Ixodes scapularis]|eukprot:XP_002402459.1 hypothetical protein IscW_ISCW000860 [Ixodes scapularis]